MNRNIDIGIRRSWWYEVYWPQYVGGAELSTPLPPRETFSLNPFLCCSSGYCCCQHLTSVDTEPAWSSSPDCSLQKIESFHSQSVIKLVLELAFWLSEELLARRGEWDSAGFNKSSEIPPCSSASDWPPGSELSSDWLGARDLAFHWPPGQRERLQ